MTDLRQEFQTGLSLHEQGRLDDAKAVYERILRLDPRYFGAHYLLGVLALQTGRTEHGVALIRQAIGINPNVASAHGDLGNALAEQRRFDEALASYDKAITLEPNNAEMHFNRGNALAELKRFDDAIAAYDAAIALQPGYAAAHCNRGNALKELTRFDAALASYDQAIALKPDYADAYYNRGVALQELKRLDAALSSYDKTLALTPDYAAAHYNRGNVLKELKQFDGAISSYDRAIALQPAYAMAHGNRGNTLLELKRFDEALASYDRAIALTPDYAVAHSNHGNALLELRRFDEALISYSKAIALQPDHAVAHNNRGNALLELKRFDAALISFDKAIALQPDYAVAHYNRGNALRELKRFDDALVSYERAMTIDPGIEFLRGAHLQTKMTVCDWHDYEEFLRGLTKQALAERASIPFYLVGLPVDAASQKLCSEAWVSAKCPPSYALPPIGKYSRHQKIRLGYFSADFHHHATAILMAELFERHDRSRFELFAFSFGPDTDDPLRRRLLRSFDQFHDVRSMSDRDVALLARPLEIDIAIDLKGFTQDARTGIFALRAAPVQVSYLGYPGTMGAPYIDYLVADAKVIPPDHRQHYCEKIVTLPECYQPNDRQRAISEKHFTRADVGLPATGFVFCCFNNNYKITPDQFDGWMRILRAVDGSVLWLLLDNPGAARNLRAEASKRGVDASRLVFAPRLPLPEHLARHRLADLFLDTVPCNAHTTASDALWAGLPVLTQLGDTFAGRVAASLLSAIGLPELITTVSDAYETLAIELARDPARLAAIRLRLKENRLTTPLFDTERLTRNVEAAYVAIYERCHAGLPPDHISL